MAIRARAFILANVLAAAASSPVVAQEPVSTVTIAGVVRDTGGRVLPGAEVRSGEHFTLTSDSGTFVLAGLTPDTVELMVRRIGFRPVVTAFTIRPGLTVSVAVRMTPSDVRLGTIVVEGKKVDAHLWQTGFYQRAKLGMGTFFMPEYLEHYGGSVSSLVAEVPSIVIQRDRHNRVVPMGRFGGGQCQINVFLDGRLVRWAPDVGLDGVLAKTDLLAVEVYPRAALVPSVLIGSSSSVDSNSPSAAMTSQGQRSDCGAIFLWTKPFSPPAGD